MSGKGAKGLSGKGAKGTMKSLGDGKKKVRIRGGSAGAARAGERRKQ
jgi:hypothetical protein